MLIDLNDTELSLLVSGLAELVHGGVVPEAEWPARMGAPRAAAEALLARVGQAHSALVLSGTGAMQDMVLAAFDGTPPSEARVAELTEAAAGPENAALRAALQHYAVLRALGPGWLMELAGAPGARAAIPAAIWGQMQHFLGAGSDPSRGEQR